MAGRVGGRVAGVGRAEGRAGRRLGGGFAGRLWMRLWECAGVVGISAGSAGKYVRTRTARASKRLAHSLKQNTRHGGIAGRECGRIHIASVCTWARLRCLWARRTESKPHPHQQAVHPAESELDEVQPLTRPQQRRGDGLRVMGGWHTINTVASQRRATRSGPSWSPRRGSGVANQRRPRNQETTRPPDDLVRFPCTDGRHSSRAGGKDLFW